MHYTKKQSFYRLLTSLIIISSLFMGGCIRVPRIYKLDIEQGNKLTKEEVSSITIGMSKDEVQGILGTPVLNTIFQKDNLYYIYYKKPGYGKLEKNYLIVYFTDGVVSKICEDYITTAGKIS